MSADGSVELEWRYGTNRFRLGLREIRILQEKTGYGPLHLSRRLDEGVSFIDEWRLVILHGLMGGGMSPQEANRAVALAVDDKPMGEALLVARIVLGAAIAGVDDDPLGKSEAPVEAESPTPTSEAASSSRTSTASALQ